VRAADCLGRGLRQAQVADLAVAYQLAHRSDRLLDRDLRIDAVLVVEVDVVDAEPLERGVAGIADVLGTAIDANAAVLFDDVSDLVASTRSSRRSAIAPPTSRSLVAGPYMSAVSSRVTPRSRAR